jgi:hypothetical protein
MAKALQFTVLEDGGMNPTDPASLDTGSYGGHGRMADQRAHNYRAVDAAHPGFTWAEHREAARVFHAAYTVTKESRYYFQASAHDELAFVIKQRSAS